MAAAAKWFALLFMFCSFCSTLRLCRVILFLYNMVAVFSVFGFRFVLLLLCPVFVSICRCFIVFLLLVCSGFALVLVLILLRSSCRTLCFSGFVFRSVLFFFSIVCFSPTVDSARCVRWPL